MVVGRLVATWSVLAESRDRAVDQPRVDLAHHLVAETERGKGAGPVVLDHDVGALHEAFQDVAAGLGLQIQRDRPLVGALSQIARPHAPPVQLAVGTAVASLVRIVGMLHLDDLGA